MLHLATLFCCLGGLVLSEFLEPEKQGIFELDFQPLNDKVTNAVGICPDCGGMMYRCIRSADREGFSEEVRVSIPCAG